MNAGAVFGYAVVALLAIVVASVLVGWAVGCRRRRLSGRREADRRRHAVPASPTAASATRARGEGR